MPLTITITGYVPPANIPLTLRSLRKAFQSLSVNITGTVGNGEVVDGSITPAKMAQGAFFYGGTAGYASKTYSVTLTPALTAFADGLTFSFKAGADCEDGPILINPNSLGGKKAFKRAGEALVAGDIRANQIIEVRYSTGLDSGNGGFFITNETNLPRALYYTTTGTVTSGVCVSFQVTTNVPFRSLAEITGVALQIRFHADVTFTSQLTVDGITAPLTFEGDAGNPAPLQSGDLIAGITATVVHDGTRFRILSQRSQRVFPIVDQTSSPWSLAQVGTSGHPTNYSTGELYPFIATNPNVSSPVPQVQVANGSLGGLATYSLKKYGTRSLASGDVKGGMMHLLAFDGSNMQVLNPACPVVLAMANFDGSAASPITPRAGYNIHATNKIVKNSTGNYTINFDNALPNTNYCVLVCAGYASGSIGSILIDPVTYQLTGSCRIGTYAISGGAFTDATWIQVVVIGLP